MKDKKAESVFLCTDGSWICFFTILRQKKRGNYGFSKLNLKIAKYPYNFCIICRTIPKEQRPPSKN